MRRRRNADAPAAADAAATPDVVPDASAEAAEVETSDSLSASSSETASDAGKPAPAEVSPADAPDVVTEESPTETPKPRRRAARRKSAAAPPIVEGEEDAAGESPSAQTEAVPAAVPEATEAAVEPTEATVEPSLEAVPEAAKPKTPRRRRTPATATTTPEAETVPVTVPVVDAAPVDAAVPAQELYDTVAATSETAAAPAEDEPVSAPVLEAAEPSLSRPGRRRGTRRRNANTDEAAQIETPTTEAAPVAEGEATADTSASSAIAEAAADETPASETADGTPSAGRGRRSRGGRRRRTEVAVAADATGEAPSDSGESVAEGAQSAESDEAGTATEPRRRQRGPRLQRTARGGETTPSPVAAIPVAPAEPLPPPYQPLPDEVLARLPETRVALVKNVPELTVNGEPRLPLWFFVNTEEALVGDDPAAREVAQRQIRLAYEAGIRFFTVLAHLPWKMRSGERRFAPLDDALQFVAENAPDALVLPRLIFSPPSSWERAHGDQMTLYPSGETGDVSFGSRLFWEGDADETLRAAVEHVAQGEHAGRVFGFFLEHGEWFHEKGRGYDVSPANTQAFRAWLRTRYKGSQVALRAAWYDGEVTFDTADIPPALPPVSGNTSAPLFYSDREQRYVDFNEYSSDVIAGVILRMGKAVKEASGGRSAVAVSYGYTLELSRAYSGHLALGQVLASSYVDILTGPVSYSGRTPGGSAPLPSPVDSVALAGKLWVSEDDTKTFLAQGETPDVWNPKVSSLDGTWAVQARNFGTALTRGAGVSWMDSWGMGWLDDRELWQRLARLRWVADAIALRRREPDSVPAPEPDVAVIVDERSYFDLRADESVLSHLIAQQRDALLRSGARIGFYLLSDLLKKDFPRTPRLLLFLNAFRMPDTLRAAIRERFQDDGRTLAWVYGPGACETNLGELTDVIGMQMRLQPWGSKVGTQPLSNARSPLSDALRGQRLGEETRLNPSFYVADSRATPLGEYVASGNTSLAVRVHARWQSVFIGEMALTIPLLRGLYRVAGVPVFTVDDDVATVGESLLSLHSAPGGGTTVYLPEEGVLYDLLSGETLATDGWGARLSMPPRGTRLLFWGSSEEVEGMNGDPRAGSPGLTESERLPKPLQFVFEKPAATDSRAGGVPAIADRTPSPDVSPEDEALMRAALAGEIPGIPGPDDIDDPEGELYLDAPAATETLTTLAPVAETGDGGDADAAKRKRRRRRRGRGRGAGEGGDDSSLESETAEGEGDEGERDEGERDAADPLRNEDDAFLPIEGEVPALVGGFAFDLGEDVPTVPATPLTPRGRPTLEELLPQSEAVAEGVDLPPIPEELLPLESPAVGEDERISPSEAAQMEAESAPRPRRRRGGVRRSPSTEASEGKTEGSGDD